MFIFTIEHKHCGMTTTIKGYDVWDALRNNNKDISLWIIKKVEKN